MNPKPIKPYDLEVISNSPEIFYKKLSQFTDQFSLLVFNQFSNLIKDYSLFNQLHPNDAVLDILITGVLCNNYGHRKYGNIQLKSETLSLLYKLRKVSPAVKKSTDKLRGNLAYNWLSKPQKVTKDHNLRTIYTLIHFLKGTCEYTEEVLRMQEIIKYLKSKKGFDQTKIIRQIAELAAKFENNANVTLAAFTLNVRNFWKANKHQYKSKENYYFASRKPVEYHLNMVGAELMNRTLNPIFKTTQRQVILVPTCMSKKHNCQKKNINGELICTQCSKDCNVSNISQRFNSTNIRVVLIPHSSKFSKYLKPWANQNETGLIGVACILNLLKGGFEMKRLGIPSQCVFLNYAGCAKHWKLGIPTNLSKEKLTLILNKNSIRKSQLRIA